MSLPPFMELVEEHAGVLHRYLRAAVGPSAADDCLQETLLAALRGYDRLRDASNLRGWLLTIARRKAIDEHRARGRRAVPVPGVPEEAGEAPPEVDEELWAAVAGLPPKQREAVVLRYACDLPYRQIGELMGTSEAAARRSAHEGIAKLREVWR